MCAGSNPADPSYEQRKFHIKNGVLSNGKMWERGFVKGSYSNISKITQDVGSNPAAPIDILGICQTIV